MKDFLTNGRVAWIAIGLFLICLVWFSTARAETIFEVGPSQVSDSLTTGVIATVSERFKDRYDLTLGYISEQKLEFDDPGRGKWVLRPQVFACAEATFKSPWSDAFRLGLGPCYFQNDDRVAPTKFRIGLKAEWRISRRWGIAARHWSTAGTSPVGCYPLDYRKPNAPGARCNDWNTGQDSWLRIVYYTE